MIYCFRYSQIYKNIYRFIFVPDIQPSLEYTSEEKVSLCISYKVNFEINCCKSI